MALGSYEGKITTRTVHTASDGEEFSSLIDAKTYQARLDFLEDLNNTFQLQNRDMSDDQLSAVATALDWLVDLGKLKLEGV